MKKRILSIMLVCVMLFGVIAMIPASAAVVHSTPNNISSSTKLNALYGTPTVDGVIGDNEGWDDAEFIPLEYVFQRSGWGAHPEGDPAEECDVKYKAMWDENLVYFLIEIKDDELTPDLAIPDNPSHTDSKWYWNDCLFLFVSENGCMTGQTAGNSYQLVLPLTEEYEDTAIVRRGGKSHSGKNNDIDHPVGDDSLTRKTTIDGGNVVIELSLKRRAELVGETNFVGMSMGLGIQYFDVDRSSPEAQAAISSNFSKDPRTMTVSSYEGAEVGNSNDNMENSKGRNNTAGIKFTTKYEVLKGTPEIDGKIDGVWNDAKAQEFKNIVTINGTGNESLHPEKKDSCSIYAKNIYDDSKIYLLVVIEDDDFCYGKTDKEWKNDSLMVKLGEQQYWYSEHNSVENNSAITYATQNTYEFYIHPVETTAFSNGKNIYVRNGYGKAENISFDYQYSVEGDNENGYTIIMEVGITLKNFDNKAGNAYYIDYQYNDANPTYDASQNNRDLVVNCITGDLGLNNGNVLGKMVLSEEYATQTLTHNEYKADGASFYYQASADGSSYRIVGLIEEASLANIEGIKITFSNGETTKSITVTSAKAYSSIDATFDGATVTYIAEEGSVILGWVITGIDEEGYAPSAVAVINS